MKYKLPRFPVMLRKMWSGGEVQEWLDENVAPLFEVAPSPEWVKTSDRLPTREDADEHGKVWALLCGKVVLEDWDSVFDLLWWMPKPRATPPEPPEADNG